MLLARSPRRRREMAVRKTLGATRGRLVRQLLMESIAVSLSGAVVGVGVAAAATRFVTRTTGLEIPMLSSVSIDTTALLFTAAIAILAGIAVGIVPALQVSEGEESQALSSGSRGSSVGVKGRRLRETLVVAQVAMACVLLVFGGLVLKSFGVLMDVDLGFEPAGGVAWQLNPTRDFEELEDAVAYFEGVVASVAATPGVEAVGLTDALPLGRNRTWGIGILGRENDENQGRFGIFPHIVDHRYTAAMGIDLVEGRYFTADDTRQSAPVVLINETAARVMFPEGSPIGQFFVMWYGELEIVGVVADVKHESLDMGSTNEVYFPIAQIWSFGPLDMIVRSRLPTEVMTASVGEAIRAVDPQIPIDDNWTLDSLVEASVSPRRFTLQLLGAFAASALLLAGLGIYGVLSYSVTERIPEIGIRMALGASAQTVRRSVVGQTAVLALVGVVLGTGASLVGTRLISSLLFGVEPHDPVTFLVMIVVLLLVALVSGLIPAIRASRTDSAGALRSAA
jgi:predicted permease